MESSDIEIVWFFAIIILSVIGVFLGFEMLLLQLIVFGVLGCFLKLDQIDETLKKRRGIK